MLWEEIHPGVFRTEFGGPEKIYQRVASLFTQHHREHYRVHCVCTLDLVSDNNFDGRGLSGALKDAWRALRNELPALGLVADGPSHKIYRALDEEGVQAWLEQTYFVETDRNVDQVIAIEPRDLPSLHFIPSTSQVVVLFSHWRIDALGTNMVLDRLFTLAVRSMTDLPPATVPTLDAISPSIEDAAGAAESWTAEQDEYSHNFIQDFRENSFQNDSLDFKGDQSTPPGAPAGQTLTLDVASTTALIAACKMHSITVTAAAHAALAQAVFAIADAGGRPALDYTCATSINVRPRLRPPFNTPAHAVQTYVMGVGCRVRRDASFLTSASHLARHYKTAHADARVLPCLRAIYKYNADATPARQQRAEADAAAAAAPTRPPSGITISSLGVVDDHLTGIYGGGALRVARYYFGIEMATRQMIMYVGTFQGRLQVSISYNAGYYDPDVPLDVLARMKAHLEEGLGIELTSA